jgi:hypothetical protein
MESNYIRGLPTVKIAQLQLGSGGAPRGPMVSGDDADCCTVVMAKQRHRLDGPKACQPRDIALSRPGRISGNIFDDDAGAGLDSPPADPATQRLTTGKKIQIRRIETAMGNDRQIAGFLIEQLKVAEIGARQLDGCVKDNIKDRRNTGSLCQPNAKFVQPRQSGAIDGLQVTSEICHSGTRNPSEPQAAKPPLSAGAPNEV